MLSSSVAATVSPPLPDVPLPTPPVVSQTRPTPQLRTSARVLNKQRREETKVDPALTASVVAKKPDTSGKRPCKNIFVFLKVLNSYHVMHYSVCY